MAELEQTYDDVIGYIEKAQKRAAKAVHLECKTEMAQETYPLLQAVTEFFAERLDRAEHAIAELLNQTESFIQPDLAEQIIGALNVGRQLAVVVGKLRVGNLDAVTLSRLKQFGAAFMGAAAATEQVVAEVTLEPETPEEGEDEGDEDDEDTDGGEEPVDANAPVEVEIPGTPAANTPIEVELPAAQPEQK